MAGHRSAHDLPLELIQRLCTDPSTLELLDATTDGIWYRDVESPNEEWLSPRCKKLLGYDDDEILTTSGWRRNNMHPDDSAEEQENLTKHCADPNHPFDQVVRYHHKDGSTVWVRCRGMAIRDNNGKAIRILATHTDITSEKRIAAKLSNETVAVKKALQGSTADGQLLRALIDRSPDLIYIKDTESRYLVANKALADQIGTADPAELLGKADLELNPEEQNSEHLEREQEVLRTGQSLVAQPERRIDPKGKLRWFSSTKAPLYDEAGETIGLVGIGRDITNQRRTEDDLARAYERLEVRTQQHTEELARAENNLEAADEEFDALTYLASHGLQEPLRNLISFTHLLEEDLGDDVPEQVAQDLHFISTAAARMRELVQNLLALSRAGRATANLDRLRLDDRVDECLTVLRTHFDQRGARLKRTPLPEVSGDRAMLTVLYENLLSNAVKFAADSEPAIELTAQKTGREWVLGVKDNGIGVEPRHTDRIFAPFSRIHAAAEYAGSGIGLAICRKAVERHGGSIWVESEPGKGSHFKFTLPADMPKAV